MQIAPFFTTSVNPTNAPPPYDPYFANDVLLLQGEGSRTVPLFNGVYIDESLNNAGITVTSAPTQGSFGPYPGMSSLDTTIGVNSTSPNSVYAAGNIGGYAIGGSDDYTIEAYIYIRAFNAGYYPIYQSETNVTTSNGTIWVAATPTLLYCSRHGGGAVTMAVNQTFNTDTWYHIVVTRASGTTKFFINGVENTSFGAGSAGLANGAAYTSNGAMLACLSTIGSGDGYISGFRYVKGFSLYSTNFTPPTTNPTAVTGTQLLMNFANAGVADTVGRGDVQLLGDAARSFSVPKYGVGSLAFDGSGDRIVYRQQAADSILTGDFTVECWVYPTTVSGTFQLGVAQWQQTSGAEGFAVLSVSGSLQFYFGPASNVALFSGGTLTANTWQHVAFTRSGSTFRGFLNGTQVGTSTSASTSAARATTYTLGNFYSSSGTFPASGVNDFAGYADEVRITKGVARYTADFIPPDGPGA